MESSNKCGLFPHVGSNAGSESEPNHNFKYQYLTIRKSKWTVSSFPGLGNTKLSL